MATLTSLPSEMYARVLSSLKEDTYEGKCTNQDILNLAMTSKLLSAGALAALYESIIIEPDPDTLVLLAQRLMCDPDLAQAVRQLSCLGDPDDYAVEYPPSDTFVTFAECQFLDFGFPSENLGECVKQLKRSHPGYVLCVIALSCPKLVSLAFCSSLGSTEEDCFETIKIFEGSWPWEFLENLHVQFQCSPNGKGDESALLLGDIWRKLSVGTSISHLRCDNLGTNGPHRAVPRPSLATLRIRFLELQNTYDDGHGNWNTIPEFVDLCHSLEELTLHFRRSHPKSWIAHQKKLVKSLRNQKSTLKCLRLGSLNDYDITHDEIWTEWKDLEPDMGEVVDLTKFSVLTKIEVPVAFIFGPAFFVRIPRLEPDSDMANMTAPHWVTDFHTVLSDNLPPVLQHLTLWLDSLLQAHVLGHALATLLRQRGRFQQLKTICIMSLSRDKALRKLVLSMIPKYLLDPAKQQGLSISQSDEACLFR